MSFPEETSSPSNEWFDPVAFTGDVIAHVEAILQDDEAFDGDERTVEYRKFHAAESDVDAALQRLTTALTEGVSGAEEQYQRLLRFRLALRLEEKEPPVWEGEVLARAADFIRRGGHKE